MLSMSFRDSGSSCHLLVLGEQSLYAFAAVEEQRLAVGDDGHGGRIGIGSIADDAQLNSRRQLGHSGGGGGGGGGFGGALLPFWVVAVLLLAHVVDMSVLVYC